MSREENLERYYFYIDNLIRNGVIPKQEHGAYYILVTDIVNRVYKEVEDEITELQHYKNMVEWMEENSNISICDYYNNLEVE